MTEGNEWKRKFTARKVRSGRRGRKPEKAGCMGRRKVEEFPCTQSFSRYCLRTYYVSAMAVGAGDNAADRMDTCLFS